MLERSARELRYAWRGLAARPAASVGTVLVLTLGVGLTSAMFAIADPFLLRPLPYAAPDNLVLIRVERKSRDALGPPPTLRAWAARTDLFDPRNGAGAPASRLRFLKWPLKLHVGAA